MFFFIAFLKTVSIHEMDTILVETEQIRPSATVKNEQMGFKEETNYT